MTLLRNIVSDLVEKRLWPVAVLLVAALAAVPVALGGAPEAPPAPMPGPAVATQPGQVVTVAGAPGSRRRSGRLRNPFTPAKGASVADVAEQLAAQAGAQGAEQAREALDEVAGGPGADTTPAPTAPGPTTPSPETPATEDGDAQERGPRPASALVRFGGPDAQPTRLEVLGALPAGEEDPLVVLLEIEDGAATFMLTTAMTTLGDGTCAPAPEDCQTLSLGPGEVQFLEVPAADGTVVQHELEVVSVREADEGGDTGDAEDESAEAIGARAGAATAATGPARLDLGTARGVREDVARLAPLPTTEDARVLFLGPRPGGRAAFLNVTGAPVRTTGRCRPSADACRVVELRAREVAVVDGDVVLAVRRLRARRAGDAAQRTSPAGQTLARHLAVAGLLEAADLTIR